MEVLLDVGAIVAQLLHLATHVWTLIQPYFVGTMVLQEEYLFKV